MLELVAPFLLTAVGALVVWYADACRRGTVRRQRILGYRTALTMCDPKAWIVVHRAMAPLFYIAGGGAVLAGLAGGALVLLGITAAVAVHPRGSDRLTAPVDDSLRPPRGSGRARLQGPG